VTHLHIRLLARFSRLTAQITWTWTHATVWLFGLHIYCSPFRVSNSSKTLILGAWISISSQMLQIVKHTHYQNYCIDHNQILDSDRDHLVLSEACTNVPQTNPRWRTATILKKRKIAICLKRIDQFWQNLARWCVSDLRTQLGKKTYPVSQ